MRYSLNAVTALLFIFGGALGGVCFGDALDFYTPPAVSAPLMQVSPTVDGIIEPGEWEKAGALNRFVSLGGRGMPTAQTEMWVGYDQHNLYIGAKLHDPDPSQIKAEAQQRDGAVAQDDCIEMFFDPTNEGTQFIHFIVSAAGVRYDALGQDAGVDYRWDALAARLESGWSVEMRLPFEGDIPPSPGAVWGFVGARWSPHLSERSSTTRLSSALPQPGEFGGIIFARGPATMKIATLGGTSLGETSAAVVVSNLGATSFTGKVNVRVMAPHKRDNYYGAVKVAVEPGQNSIVTVPYLLRQDGLNVMQLSLTDTKGETVNRTAPYPIELPSTGAELARLEDTLNAALRVWVSLEDSEYKTRAAAQLDALLGEWQRLAATYKQRRNSMTYDELAKLGNDIAEVTARAQLVKMELDAHVQTQADAGTSIKVGSAFAARPADGTTTATLHVPVSGVDALGLVVSPFPRRASS